jgi:hypothetical protein
MQHLITVEDDVRAGWEGGVLDTDESGPTTVPLLLLLAALRASSCDCVSLRGEVFEDSGPLPVGVFETKSSAADHALASVTRESTFTTHESE